MASSLRVRTYSFVLKWVLHLHHNDVGLARRCIANLPVAIVEQDFLQSMCSELERWIAKHARILPSPMKHFDDLIWDPADASIPHADVAQRLLKQSDATPASRRLPLDACFHLAAVYALRDEAVAIWDRLPDAVRSSFLAERSNQFDPILIFWTGMCAGQPWLSDSYLVRAFYWAAEHNYAEALAYFWTFIGQQRADAVNFRCVRAFQLAASHSHLEIIEFLWAASTPAQHGEMIQAVLANCSTASALCIFEEAARNGNLQMIEFLFRAAAPEQLKLMIRANEFSAFRYAVANGRAELVELFLSKAEQVGVKRWLLLSDNCFVVCKAIEAGQLEVLSILWRFASAEEKELIVRSDVCTALDTAECRGNSNTIEFLWANCVTKEQRSLILSDYLIPSVLRDLAKDRKPQLTEPKSINTLINFGNESAEFIAALPQNDCLSAVRRDLAKRLLDFMQEDIEQLDDQMIGLQ